MDTIEQDAKYDWQAAACELATLIRENRAANREYIDAIAAEVDAELMAETRAAYRSFVERERADQNAATEIAKSFVAPTSASIPSAVGWMRSCWNSDWS